MNALEQQITSIEPHLLNKNGDILSLKEFKQKCTILRSDKLTPDRNRKYCILFGVNEEGRYKYRFKIYAKGGEKNALQLAMNCLKAFLSSDFDPLYRFCGEQAWVEYFDPQWNRKIPLTF